MLALQQRALSLRDADDLPARQLRFGVTELTALTWLPRIVADLRTIYPGVQLKLEVDLSRDLFERLREDTIDLIVIPEAFFDPRISALRLAEVHNSWMSSPDLIRGNRTFALEELGAYLTLENRLLKKSMIGDGGEPA
jgi:DNA-binding transcriptional LysR family regulator